MIIVEGIDGTGKTTLVTALKNQGYNDVKYNYYEKTQTFADKYFNIDLDTVKDGISDRSFISEVAKGNLVRGVCRLSDSDYEKLLDYYSSFGTIIIYLKANKNTLLERRKDDPDDIEMLINKYEDLNARYDEVMEIAKKYIMVYEMDTSKFTASQVIEKIKRLRNNGEWE